VYEDFIVDTVLSRFAFFSVYMDRQDFRFSPEFVTGLGMGGGFGFFTAGATHSDVYSKNQAARFGALMGVMVSGVFLAVFIYVSEYSLSAVGGVLAGYIISAFCGVSLLCYLERRKPTFWIRFRGK
jgi:hypothetical protein